MKATIDVPDDLYRRVKARSALEGRSVRDVALELFKRWLGEAGPGVDQSRIPSFHDVAKAYCGKVESGVTDLATNPKYLEDFGRDSLGHR